MADASDPPEIPITCPECDTRGHVPFPEVEMTLEEHNERLHDGEQIAAVDPAVFDHLADQLATDLGLLEE